MFCFEPIARAGQHCQRLAPIYEALAAMLKDEGLANIHVAKVDGAENKLLATRFGVKGFPSLFFIHEGDVYEVRPLSV